MPRTVDPDYAERVTTNISTAERAAVDQVARDERTTPAQVIRWAIRDYLAQRAASHPERRATSASGRSWIRSPDVRIIWIPIAASSQP